MTVGGNTICLLDLSGAQPALSALPAHCATVVCCASTILNMERSSASLSKTTAKE